MQSAEQASKQAMRLSMPYCCTIGCPRHFCWRCMNCRRPMICMLFQVLHPTSIYCNCSSVLFPSLPTYLR